MSARELKWQWLLDAPTEIPKTPAAQALDRKLVTPMDLVRLKILARLHARGLAPHMEWSDLLQEAFRRVLDGSRSVPDGVPVVAFMAGVMRSIKSEQRRRARGSAEAPFDARMEEVRDTAPDALRSLIAIDEVYQLRALIAGDADALNIMEGIYEGLTSEEIRARHSMSTADYDAARKRIRRALIKEGVKWSPEP